VTSRPAGRPSPRKPSTLLCITLHGSTRIPHSASPTNILANIALVVESTKTVKAQLDPTVPATAR
jgi:hypothetical protein